MPVFEGDAARGAARASFSSNYELISEDANRLMNEGSEEAQASLNLPAVSTTSSVEEQDVRMEMEMGFDNSPSIGEKAMKVDCDKGPALKVDPAAALTEDLDWDLGYLL